jgi:hypothetical protein
MSKHVTQHCSILNYIRHANKDLYTLIEELCLGRILVPKKGKNGLTFLMPEKEMVDKLFALEAKGNGEEVVDQIRAMVLQGCYEDIKDFHPDRGQMVTSSNKVLPVSSVEKGVIHLKHGQKITLDTDFKRRSDRTNIIVYNLTGKLLNIDDMELADTSVKPRVPTARGGAEYGTSKALLFEQVLAECAGTVGKRDPALEVLVSLMLYLKTVDQATLECVQSLLSNDTLTTLAIVLQPYKTAGTMYISSDTYEAWREKYSNKSTPLFSYVATPVALYKKAMATAASKYTTVIRALHEIANENLDAANKTNISTMLANFYKTVSSQRTLPANRLAIASSPKEAIAEAELRVLGYMLQDDHTFNLDEANRLYKTNCSLDAPFLCTSNDAIKNMSTGVFYSTAYLIIRCEALFYLPGYSAGWQAIGANIAATGMLSLNESIILDDSLDTTYTQIVNEIKAQLNGLDTVSL